MADEIIQRNQINEDVITLVAEGRQFMCHKSKLMASSDYFRAMFSNNFIEHAQDTIELQGIDADCLLLLLQYVESGSYVIPSDNVLALLQTAAMLQFISVQIACEQQVLASLSCDTCLEVYFVTSTLGLSNIATAALTIAVWKFLEIVKKPQFHHLSLSEMVEYISHPALFLGPNGEWTVWEALISWIEENEAERTEHLLKLLLCLDFYSLTREDISNMLFYNIVSENNEAVQLLEGIGKYKMAHLQQRLSCQNQDMELMKKETSNSVEKQTNPEKHDSDKDSEEHEVRTLVESAVRHSKRHIPQVPCIVGFKRSHSSQRKKEAKNSDDDDDADLIWSFRKRNLENIPVIYSLNPVTKKITEEITLTKLCDGPVQCSGYQVCSVGPSIYILGGEYQLGHGNWNQSLWRYSTVSKKWIVENSLPQPRRHHMVCVVDSIIYILGGYGKHRIVQSSVNAYDTESGDWLHCPDMPHCVSQGAACAFKGRLMVFTQEMQLLTYYPTMKKWSAIPVRSPSIQGYRAALTWENSVYLIDFCTTQVYKFSPEEDQTITQFGNFVTPPLNVCIVDGKIYNFTHDDVDDSHVIEVLDICEGLHTSNVDTSPSGNSGMCSMSGIIDSHQCEPLRVLAKEIWREKEGDPYMFTSYPAKTTFSLGCFPLFTLKT
ncbi:kelch-like protein 24 isoform X1 [Panulirus ornatus]|uniref:kelch-like protein 24 isoform X1 n=2 Tax=Panulirus ornatus TaxID=150431 RepID=UPI003A8C5C10